MLHHVPIEGDVTPDGLQRSGGRLREEVVESLRTHREMEVLVVTYLRVARIVPDHLHIPALDEVVPGNAQGTEGHKRIEDPLDCFETLVDALRGFGIHSKAFHSF